MNDWVAGLTVLLAFGFGALWGFVKGYRCRRIDELNQLIAPGLGRTVEETAVVDSGVQE